MDQNNTQIMACAGIDVSKAWLDIALASEAECWREDNTAEGHLRLVNRLKNKGIERVGLEATGHYEASVAEALRAGGLVVVVFQPRQVKAYGVFKLKRAKSDRIDAQLIAQCTRALDKVWEAPDPRLAPFAEHLTRIEQIEEDLARAKIRRERFRDQHCLAQLEDDIARLKALKTAELKRLGRDVRAHADWARKMTLLLSIPGIGERTALALLIRMPELGRLSREEAAALAGVAPYVDASGKSKGGSHIAGGRARVRTSLFAAAQAAARQWNPALIDLYDRLVKQGKAHTLAITACVRKLVIYANTILARNEPWKIAQ
jgi:transposase